MDTDKLSITLRLMGFLNASHYAVFNGKRGQTHSHSWQFQLEVEVPVNGGPLVRFEDLEKLINITLKPYQRTVLNEVAPFDQFQPFTENIAVYFFNTLSDILEERGSGLTKLIVWENPTKGVEITQRLPYYILAGQIDTNLTPIINTAIPNEQSGIAELAAVNEQIVPLQPDVKMVRDDADIKQPEPIGQRENGIRLLDILKWTVIVLAILAAGMTMYHPVLGTLKPPGYPWGSDAWGHLYKAEFLTKQISQGNYFPQFWADWYNGCQPFRYWAPLPYYTLAGLNYLTANIFTASYYYIFLCALFGALGWLFWKKRLNPVVILMVALIYLIWPDNVRVAFSEGNFPRVLSTALLPLLVVCYLNVLEKKRIWGSFIATVFLIQLAVLCHAMMGAVDCVALFMVTVFHWIYGGSSLKQASRAVAALIMGILLSSWWLIPALNGGIVGMGSAASGGVFYLSFLDAFNPFHFNTDKEFQYLGISLLPMILFTLVTWKKRPVWSRALFSAGAFFIIISFPSFAWLHRLIPLSDMLWPFRFRSIASLMLLASMAAVTYPIVSRRNVLQYITVGLLVLVIIDSGYAASKLIYPGEMPVQVLNVSKEIAVKPGWRVAALDISTLGSPPSYLFSVEGKREQVFGWAWQGATTATNIMLLNTAMEHKLYPFVIKQLYFLGGTDVVANPYAVKKPAALNNLMSKFGYQKIELQDSQLSYWHGSSSPYFVAAKPKGLAIGKFANMYAMQFPALKIGDSANIDDYSLQELKSFPVLVLSGAGWKSRTVAEHLVIDYARQGGRVVVDLTGFPVDVFSKQPKFLNVYGQSASLKGSLHTVSAYGDKLTWQPFDYDSLPWLTQVPMPLDKVEWTFDYMNNQAALFGYKEVAGVKIAFLGGNPVYHSFLTGDPAVRRMLGQWLGLSEDYEVPSIVPVQKYQADKKGYTFVYSLANEETVVVPIARLDGMQAYLDNKKVLTQSYENLVSIKLPAGQHELRFTLAATSVYTLGWGITGFTSLLVLLLIISNLYQGDWPKHHKQYVPE